jgi:hypothetical protein
VFPIICSFGWGVMILIHLIKHRSFHPDHKRLIAGAAIAAGVLIPASIAVCGVSSYTEFAHHIGVHKETPLTNHMGLETILVHNWDGRMLFTQDDRLDDPFAGWKEGRRDRKHDLRWVHRGIILFVAAWIAWALRRTKLLWVGVGLSVPLVLSLLNLTCYYYAVFLATIVLVRVRPALAAALLATSAASQVIHYRFYFIDDKFTAHSYLFYFCGLLLIWGYSRPFSLERLRAWWQGKPEPRDKPAELPPKPATSDAE